MAEQAREKIKGIFSTQEVKKVGTGTTTRKTIQKAFWSAEEAENETLDVQPLNANYIPSGPKKSVSMDEFIEKFQPEPEFYVQTVLPKMKELNKTIARADRHRAKGESFSAEFEYGNALKVDEENVRANFGLGLTYLDRGESEKADNIFDRLVHLEAAFDKEHKHLFNEFGISLRKNNMHAQAVDYYNRAIELSGSDDHLHYNMARVFLEQKDFESCTDHVLQCLAMNPTLEAGVKFLLWLKQKKHLPEARQQEAEGVLAKSLAAIKGQQNGSTADAPPKTEGSPEATNDTAQETDPSAKGAASSA